MQTGTVNEQQVSGHVRKLVVCAGTFDYLHPGHIFFLREAKRLGDELVVIVARDETVLRIKGFAPTHDELFRKELVENTGISDSVILGNRDRDIFRIIEELNPSVIALGYDQRVSETDIRARFPGLELVRIGSFEPDRYKSSFFRDEGENLPHHRDQKDG